MASFLQLTLRSRVSALFRYWFNSSLVSRFLGSLEILRMTVARGNFYTFGAGIRRCSSLGFNGSLPFFSTAR